MTIIAPKTTMNTKVIECRTLNNSSVVQQVKTFFNVAEDNVKFFSTVKNKLKT